MCVCLIEKEENTETKVPWTTLEKTFTKGSCPSHRITKTSCHSQRTNYKHPAPPNLECGCSLFLHSTEVPPYRWVSVMHGQSLHLGGVVGTPQKPFVQILNINDNHWITASNRFCGPNELCIYDTKFNKNTQQKLSSLLCPQAPQFLIRKPAVQMQQATSNCGLFALAFASVLCELETLYRALQNKVAPVFPYKNIQAKPERPKVQVEVECTCRTSYNRTVKTAHTTSCCVKKKVDHRAKTKILAFHLDVAKVDIAKCGATYLQFYLVLILDIMLQNE